MVVALVIFILVVVLLVIVRKRKAGSYNINTEQRAPQSAAEFDNPTFGYRTMMDEADLDEQAIVDPYKVPGMPDDMDWEQMMVSEPPRKDNETLI